MQTIRQVSAIAGRFFLQKGAVAPQIRCLSRKRRLTQFQLAKLSQEFDKVLDTNGDGYIDQADIDGFKKKMCKFARDHWKKEYVDPPYTGHYENFWELMYEYADVEPKDGKISREEWLTLWTNIVQNIRGVNFNDLPNWVKLQPKSIFPIMDYNGDDVITKDEYKLFWQEVCDFRFISDEKIDEYFNVMTENGKRPLNLPRFEELYADFYLSGDPDSPGRYVGGPMDHILSFKGGRQDIQRLRR